MIINNAARYCHKIKDAHVVLNAFHDSFLSENIAEISGMQKGLFTGDTDTRSDCLVIYLICGQTAKALVRLYRSLGLPKLPLFIYILKTFCPYGGSHIVLYFTQVAVIVVISVCQYCALYLFLNSFVTHC